MLDQMVEPEQEEGGWKKAMLAEEKLSQMSAEATRIKERMSHAMEDGVDAARRAMRKGKYAAEDLLDETAYRIKRDPINSVAITFGVGMGLGVMIGWLLTRGRR